MAHTVVGFFDDLNEAQNAVRELTASGIDTSRIDISSGSFDTDRSLDEDAGERARGKNQSGITKFFNSLFGDDSDDARKYSSVGEKANTIVTVHAQSEDEAEDVADILDDYGAFNVDERASAYRNSPGYSATGTSDELEKNRQAGNSDQTIERIEEELQVGKRSVPTGGVRLRSRIVEKPVEESVRLRQEHVHVDRQQVNRPVSEDSLRNFEETEIEFTEEAEVPVVNKEARVVEEIKVRKETEEREETIRDTVRETQVDIDNIQNSDRKDREGSSRTNSDRFGL